MQMQLHRTGKQPEWANIKPARRNGWQRLAANSGGVLTLGNFFTFVGFGLVVVGLGYVVAAGRSNGREELYAVGFVLVVLGRLCDVLDGWLADKTGTKSPLGETLDAGMDKLLTLLALPALVVATILPVWVALLIALPHVVIAGTSAYLLRKQGFPHPSKFGKLSMAAAWGSLSLFVLDAALGRYPALVFGLALGIGALSVLLGWIAAIGYARQIKR